MPMYLLPPLGDTASDLVAVITRAGAHFIQARQAGDVVRGERDGIVICSVNSTDLSIIMRHASNLLLELPTAVLAAPGSLYSADWSMLAASLPHVDWRELEAKLLKAGLLANDLNEVAPRSKVEAPLSPARNIRRLGEAAATVTPKNEVDDSDESDV